MIVQQTQREYFISTEIPSLEIPYNIAQDIMNFVHTMDIEATWYLMTVREADVIKVKGFIVPDQKCHSLTTEVSEQGEDELMAAQIEHGYHYGVWGHSHVNMGVTPSGQDHKFFENCRKNAIAGKHKYSIMMIVNKQEQVHCVYADAVVKDSMKIYITDLPANYRLPSFAFKAPRVESKYKDKVKPFAPILPKLPYESLFDEDDYLVGRAKPKKPVIIDNIQSKLVFKTKKHGHFPS